MDKRIKAELLFAFSQMYEDRLKKVPQKLRDEIVVDYDEKVFKSFDPEKPFTKQVMSEESLEILLNIFKDDDESI